MPAASASSAICDTGCGPSTTPPLAWRTRATRPPLPKGGGSSGSAAGAALVEAAESMLPGRGRVPPRKAALRGGGGQRWTRVAHAFNARCLIETRALLTRKMQSSTSTPTLGKWHGARITSNRRGDGPSPKGRRPITRVWTYPRDPVAVRNMEDTSTRGHTRQACHSNNGRPKGRWTINAYPKTPAAVRNMEDASTRGHTRQACHSNNGKKKGRWPQTTYPRDSAAVRNMEDRKINIIKITPTDTAVGYNGQPMPTITTYPSDPAAVRNMEEKKISLPKITPTDTAVGERATITTYPSDPATVINKEEKKETSSTSGYTNVTWHSNNERPRGRWSHNHLPERPGRRQEHGGNGVATGRKRAWRTPCRGWLGRNGRRSVTETEKGGW